MVETLGQPLQAAGLAVSSDIKEGDPKRVLPDIAAQWDADCLVVGVRGLSRVQRFLLGSVSAAVAARTHCFGGSHPPAAQALREREGIVVVGTDKRTSAMQPLYEGMYT